MPKPLKLETAVKYADQIVEILAPYCEKIAIAGSVRRRRGIVNDIDLVVIPKDWQGLRKRCLAKCRLVLDGAEIFTVTTVNDVQLDIFTAHAPGQDLAGGLASNWGSVLLCRTGSKEHNVWLCKKAVEKGWKWSPPHGILNAHNEILASETEEDIFKRLGLEYIEPERRERNG